MISETKLDDTFLTCKFSIGGYSKPYRLDRTAHGGELLINVNDDIPTKILQTQSFLAA